jgi:hypothetical protein
VKAGPYEVLPQTFLSLWLNLADSARTMALGWPRKAGSPAEIAAASLRENARGELWAGTGHFHFMWAADFGKTVRGAWETLGPDYLGGLIDSMTDESFRHGYVTTCFRGGRGFDMPWPRGDGLPWLVFAHEERRARTGRSPDAVRLKALQGLLDGYEATHFQDGLIAPSIAGDWVDTVRRPSSTYNNLCALMMLRSAPGLGLKARHGADEFERDLLASRWRAQGFLTDSHGVETPSADAAVVALYLGLLPGARREALATWLEASGLLDPIPMTCAAGRSDAHVPFLTHLTGGYHLSRWLHLGLMALNGLKRQGRDVSARLAAVERVIARHGQVVEAVLDDGRPYLSPFLSCERGLSMAAGQYLELLTKGTGTFVNTLGR